MRFRKTSQRYVRFSKEVTDLKRLYKAATVVSGVQGRCHIGKWIRNGLKRKTSKNLCTKPTMSTWIPPLLKAVFASYTAQFSSGCHSFSAELTAATPRLGFENVI